MQGICVGPKAVQVQGMLRNTRWGRQDICQKRLLVWDSYGQEYWITEGNGRLMGDGIDSQTNYVHKMGLINREMASRRGRPLLGEPFGLEVFWENLLDHLKHNKCLSRLLELWIVTEKHYTITSIYICIEVLVL
jgi:hypothetical protein